MFTLHKPRRGKFVPFQKNPRRNEELQKIVVPAKRFGDLRYHLERCGIHAASIFPDLDGVSARIEWLHSVIADE